VRTFWKIAVTFGVLGLFVIIIAFMMAYMIGDFKGLDLSGAGGEVAIVPIQGDITLGGCGSSLLFATSCAEVDTFKSELKAADDDPAVKAIVLDIYSGGGDVVASREMMRAVKNTEKPVVAWIGEIGASGAYYVASSADKVVAHDDSMTGSIGVIMPVTQYYKLMDNIGVNVTVIKAGDSKDIASPYRPMREDEKEELQSMIDKVYDSFVVDVARNRNLSVDYVRNISRGKIYLGSEAKDLGLVDELGGLDDAVKLAGKLGGISGEPTVKRQERKVGLLDLLNS